MPVVPSSRACLLSAVLLAGTANADPCEALKSTSFEGFRVTNAVTQAAASIPLPIPGMKPLPLPAHCQVEGIATPGPDSRIRFEVWLPARDWNQKLLVTGNGGYSSALSYWDMVPALGQGYAVAGGDTGHEGDNLSFGIGHPEKIKDWAERSVHVVAVAAKAIVEVYEKAAPRFSYYKGCSTGGGQGLMEAQRYPEDFDGIIAGAPGNNRTHLNMAFLWLGMQNLKSAEGRLSPDDFKMVSRAVVAACDAKDGLRDNVIANPQRCRFSPSSLLCKGPKTTACLTAPQVKTLAAMEQGPRNRRSGEQIYPPFPYGSEAGWAAIAGGPGIYRAQFWSGWVFDKPDWTWKEFDWDKDIVQTDKKLAAVVNATNPDLSAFRAHGGKLIVYHGLADPIVSPFDTVKYYEAVEDKAGGRMRAAKFSRLFLVQGMGHCNGGFDPMPAGSGSDLLKLLENWREKGEPPRVLSVEERKSGQLLRSRIACAYPKSALWDGKGDPDKAGSFICK